MVSKLTSRLATLDLSDSPRLRQKVLSLNTLSKADSKTLSLYLSNLFANPDKLSFFFKVTRAHTYETPVYLTLRVGFNDIDKKLRKLQKIFTKIVSLKIEDSAELTETDFQYIPYPPSLEELDVSGTLFNSDALEVLLNRCPQLKRLNFKDSQLPTLALYYVVLPQTLQWYSSELLRPKKDPVGVEPDHPLILKDQAKKCQKPEEAKALSQKLLSILPNFALAHELLAINTMILKDTETAKSHFIEALRIDPTKSLSAYYLSKILQAENKLQEAKQVLEKALTMQPNCWFCNLQLSRILFKCKEKEAAIACAWKAIECADASKLEMTYLHLSMLLFDTLAWDQLKILLERALEKFPENPNLVFRLANILHVGGNGIEMDRKAAKPLLEKTTHLLPDFWPAYVFLSEIYDTGCKGIEPNKELWRRYANEARILMSRNRKKPPIPYTC